MTTYQTVAPMGVAEKAIKSLDGAEEDIEGLDVAEDAAWVDYPIDTLLVRSEHRTVFDIVRRIDKKSFVMNPDFQRDFIWDKEKQSKLIESVLMRIPLPVFYLAENTEGKVVVVDGLQRLSTFRDFIHNKLPLKLPNQSELNGKKFQDLSPKLKNRVEDCNLTLYILDTKVPEKARLDMFERVNSGVPLSRQQMRNSIYMGPATRFLKDEANTPVFLQATGGSLRKKFMRDREFVNRFCAFQIIPLEEYRGDMDDFLAKSLVKMNRSNQYELDTLSDKFRNSLAINFQVFGKHAFRKHSKNADKGTQRSVLNASLWDVMTTGLSGYSGELVDRHQNELRSAFYALLDNETFHTAITYATNGVDRVKYRFASTKKMLSEVLGAYEN